MMTITMYLVTLVFGAIMGGIIIAHLAPVPKWVTYTFDNDMPEKGLIIIQIASGDIVLKHSKKDAELVQVTRYMVIENESRI